MKQRPILFSTPMVQAILEGRKTVTRRVRARPVLAGGFGHVVLQDGVAVGRGTGMLATDNVDAMRVDAWICHSRNRRRPGRNWKLPCNSITWGMTTQEALECIRETNEPLYTILVEIIATQKHLSESQGRMIEIMLTELVSRKDSPATLDLSSLMDLLK